MHIAYMVGVLTHIISMIVATYLIARTAGSTRKSMAFKTVSFKTYNNFAPSTTGCKFIGVTSTTAYICALAVKFQYTSLPHLTQQSI